MTSVQLDMNMSLTGADLMSAVNTFTSSKEFVKKVLRIAMLNIIYHRLQIEESNFLTKDFFGMSYRVQKKNCRDPILVTYYAAMRGIFDAIDKNYLKNVYLIMKNWEKNDIEEMYVLTVKYNIKGKPEKRTMQDLKRMVKSNMLHFLTVLEKLPKLNRNIIPHFEISYNKSAPQDYVPVHYEKSDDNLCPKNDTGYDFPLMRVRTGYHLIQGVIKGKISDKLHEMRLESPESFVRTPTDVSSVEDPIIIISDISDMDIEMPTLTPRLSCVCGLNDVDIEADVLTCVECKYRSHLPCNGYMEEPNDNYKCFFCYPHQDPTLYCLGHAERRHMARVRLCLVYMSRNKRMPKQMFEIFGENTSQIIIKQLQDLNILFGNSLETMCIRQNILEYRMKTLFDKY